ncbi:MAG TPA: hypothetical protein VIR27_05295 [Mycobacteriales bacterium]|jgi:hypothetical protein
MTTQTSAIPAVIDYLVATLTASLTEVRVIDGPGITDDSAENWLFIGVDDPDSDSAPTAAEAESDWSALGARQRREDIVVHCAAISYSGDDVMKTVRDTAFVTAAGVEKAIVADPTLAGAVLYATFGGVSAVRQNTNDQGVEAWALFTVRARARLTAT